MAPTPQRAATSSSMAISTPQPCDERDRLHHVAPAGELARQRLVQRRRARGEQRQQRPGDELGRAAAPAGVARTLVDALTRATSSWSTSGPSSRATQSAVKLVTSPSHHTTKCRCWRPASPTGRCPCRGRRRARGGRRRSARPSRRRRRRRARCRRCCGRRARSARRPADVAHQLGPHGAHERRRSSPPRCGTGCTATPCARPWRRRPPRSMPPRRRRSAPGHRLIRASTVASAAVFLFGVVNASPDSLHDGLDRHHARRGGGAGQRAAGRRVPTRSTSAVRVRPTRPTVVDWTVEWERLADDRAGARHARRRRSASTAGAPRSCAGRSSGGHRDQRRRRHAVTTRCGRWPPSSTCRSSCRSCPGPTRARWPTSPATRSRPSPSSSTPAWPTPTATALRERCILDPGTGFAPPAWPWEQRYDYQKDVYPSLDELRRFGLPLYIALPWKDDRHSTTSCSRSSSASSPSTGGPTGPGHVRDVERRVAAGA